MHYTGMYSCDRGVRFVNTICTELPTATMIPIYWGTRGSSGVTPCSDDRETTHSPTHTPGVSQCSETCVITGQ